MSHFVELFREDGFVMSSAPVTEICGPFGIMRKQMAAWLKRTLTLNDFLIGVPHYPEHVGENYWDRDAVSMAAAGFNVVRLGEFAWHIMEPR